MTLVGCGAATLGVLSNVAKFSVPFLYGVFAIPTITGGMYSPDFMYVVKKSSGEKELNIIVETKDVEGKDVLRGNEAAKIECARVFFESLSKAGYVVHFREQIKSKQIAQIINELLNN